MNHDFRRPISRREALCQAGTGFGMFGLASLLRDAGLLGAASAADTAVPAHAQTANPLAPRPAPLPARAKRVIHIYLNGGPSQVDTFDPKPMLNRFEGKMLPQGNLSTERKTGTALPSPFKFRKYGQSGIPVSEIFARTAEHADDLCVIRSMQANTPNHEQSMRLMNCGDERLSRPSMGAWLTYGMGSENENLPGYVSMCPGLPVADVSNWRSAFLPGVFQGTYIDTRKAKAEDLIENIRNTVVSQGEQRRQLDLLAELNRRHQRQRAEDDKLDARIASFELAYRMQMEATDAFDVEQEPQHVRDMYGPSVQARQLLIARRLIERGVRFVQLFHGDVQPWDSHDNIATAHRNLGAECDQGIAALLTDLKQRGLFEDTLVLCGGEFGRTPAVELVGGKPGMGRDHNHWGFSVWLAGGGVKGGHIHGATDDFGYKAVEDVVHVHDHHATILHLLGFDHTKLTYRYAGRDFRLTDVHGNVVKDVLA
ncbi:MAG: DUF1501 domain-containing protein [Paludisphaera borealis]|uniref:DUF1501 domain-containing protein n=1 Tax=Paludisphaera borealis TaxID=1387353 RepID=UPI00283E142E|nr:DUF1501 domain-containing protein [Paludisphaera borealis]MDR3617967.1 DUF1501 domain-containing protein [Paludisphaera borealis]